MAVLFIFQKCSNSIPEFPPVNSGNGKNIIYHRIKVSISISDCFYFFDLNIYLFRLNFKLLFLHLSMKSQINELKTTHNGYKYLFYCRFLRHGLITPICNRIDNTITSLTNSVFFFTGKFCVSNGATDTRCFYHRSGRNSCWRYVFWS